MKIQRKQVKEIIEACFPDNKRREAYIEKFSPPINITSRWDEGGSMKEFAIYNWEKRLQSSPKLTHLPKMLNWTNYPQIPILSKMAIISDTGGKSQFL